MLAKHHFLTGMILYIPGVYLIRWLQLLVLHHPQDIVGCSECPHLRLARCYIGWQADKPQAMAMPQQTLGPHVRYGRICLGHALG